MLLLQLEDFVRLKSSKLEWVLSLMCRTLYNNNTNHSSYHKEPLKHKRSRVKHIQKRTHTTEMRYKLGVKHYCIQ